MDIENHIKFLYWFCLLLGMIDFIYDRRKKCIEFSLRLHILSMILYTSIACISGYLALMFCLKGILRILFGAQDFVEESFLAQDEVLKYLTFTFHYVMIFINVFTFLKRKRHIQRTINDLLDIFYIIRQKTDKKMPICAPIRYLLLIKLILGVYRFVRFTSRYIFHIVKYHDISSLFGEYLWQVGSWSLMYAHVILICFYVKLTGYLDCQGSESGKRLQEVIRISFQIHRVKRRFEVIYSPFLVLMYYGLFNDITCAFGIMKEILYKHYIVGYSDPPMQKFVSLLQHVPDAISTTFEIYMIGCISQALESAQQFLQYKIIIFNTSDTHVNVRRDMEMQLIYNKVHDFSIWAYRLFKIDQRLAFNNFLNVVVMYVIICLQYFAKETVYSSSEVNHRLVSNYTTFSKKVAYNSL